MIAFPELVNAFRELRLGPDTPLIAHASLSAFGWVEGGAQAVVGALMHCFHSILMPGFTYQTMLVPEVGPPHNGITYGSRDANKMAEFFTPDMPVDRTIGLIPETLRRHPLALRSKHPILSFIGVNAARCLECQTIDEPLAPIGALAECGGWVLLLGVDHTVNTSLHYAERLAGRLQFVRWALSEDRVMECRRFPGCSDHFEAIAPKLVGDGRMVQAGNALVQAFPLERLLHIARQWILRQPTALLCHRLACERCQEVRLKVQYMAV